MSKNTTGTLIRTRSQLELGKDEITQVRATVQQLYFENGGEFPSHEMVYEKLHGIYPLEFIQEVMTDEENIERFKNVGVLAPAPVGGVLTPTQILIANKIFNFQDKDSIRMFLEANNVTTSQYNAWLRDPVFVEHLNARASQMYKDADHIAYRQLLKAMEAGDMKAVTMYLEMKGKYAKNINMNINVEVMMAKMVEIVMRHVKDADTIEAIAKDFEELDA